MTKNTNNHKPLKQVALFGGTGFVGGYLIEALLAQQWQPVVMVRPGSEHKVAQREQCKLVAGDIEDDQAVAATLQNADAVIYNIGILREFKGRDISFERLHHHAARRVMDAAQQAGVKRFLLMSANGVRPDGAAYQRTKHAAEAYLATTSLDWSIFRPSVLFGDPQGKMEFATQLLGDMIKPPLPAPLFFNGFNIRAAGQLQMAPAWVGDVARAFAKALEMPETIGKTICLCGPEALTWRTIIERIAAATQRKKLMLPVPVTPLRIVAKLFDRYPWFPVTSEQLQMLMQGNTCQDSGFDFFGITPTAFDADSLRYLNR